MGKSERTFERIYAEYYQRVYSFLHKLCRDGSAAEQLSKQTFLQAYKDIIHYKEQCEMSTWLLSVAADEYLKYLYDKASDSFEVNFYITDPEAPLSEEPGYRLMKDVDISEVKRVLTALPEKDTVVLLLRIYGEIPYKEIAGLMGISADSAKLIFIRTKEHVKEELFHD